MERNNVEKAILGGFVATLVMTVIMYLAPLVRHPTRSGDRVGTPWGCRRWTWRPCSAA